MNANDLPESLPDHLRTEANARFLEQVHLDLVEADIEPTQKTVTEAMINRLNRNLAISKNEEVKDLLRALLAEHNEPGV